MRWLFFSLSILCCVSSSSSQVLFNEIYYDHPGRDDGFEFIELINLSDTACGLDDVRIEFHDGASAGWVTVWVGQPGDTVPGPDGLFVIGGDSIGSVCDVVIDLGLQNGPDAVRLLDRSAVLDLVGYGELGDPRFCEGMSAPDTPSGTSLARTPDGADSDNNAADFTVASPSPGRFNVPRDDVSIRRSDGTPKRAVWPDVTTEIMGLRVHNNGTRSVERHEAVVWLADSTRFGIRVLGTIPVDPGLAPGDSIDVTHAVVLDRGYHVLKATIEYAADQRPSNNRIDLLRRAGPPPLLISEVMSYPRAGCPEYIELFNPHGDRYDLANHLLRDAAHQPVPITTREAFVEPGDFAVLTSDAESLCREFPDARGVVIEIDGAWPSLNHTGSGGEADSVVVLDGCLLAVDCVGYPPQPSGTQGHSLERVDLYPSNGPPVWVVSNYPGGGSPGHRYPESLVDKPVGVRVRASPNPFDPWNQECVFVTVPDQGAPSRVVVGVYGIDGRLLRDIGATDRLPTVMTWDGTVEDGERVTPGFYIVACEIISPATNSRRVEKVVVGCAKRTAR